MTITEPIAPILPTEAFVLAALAECVCTELATTGAGPMCWCGLTPGATVSWDYCGECSGDHCGMAWVRLVSVFPYQIFPQPVVDERCVNPLALAVEVGALRCLPIRPDGEPLDAEAMGEAAMMQAADLYALYRAVQCCNLGVAGQPRPRFAIQGYTPVGPDGGCVGGAWLVFLAVD